jgi:tetratricopeptide (TPR) repeat protein
MALTVTGAVAAGTASAQLAAHMPTEKILVLPLIAEPADSAASVALSDALREKLANSAKRWVQVIPKAKLCEALRASGFPCDGLLDEQQASQLARFLQVDAYVSGTLEREGTGLKALVRSFDVQGSGMAASFTVTDANPGTPVALAEKIAQRLTAIIRPSEFVRECTTERQRGQFPRALAAARKALASDPNSTGAHLCVATIYEAQRMPSDSVVAASRRALAGDSLNAAAWENIARAYQQKGDTTSMIDAFLQQLRGQPRNTSKRLAIAQTLRQMKQYERSVEVLNEGLAVTPDEPQLLELKKLICVENSMHRCTVEILVQQTRTDSIVLGDSTFLKTAIGAAQQANDTASLDLFTAAAVRRFPNELSFLKARGAYFELAGMQDSALVVYRDALRRDPSDVATSLQVAKAIIDRAVWDTAGTKDTAATRPRRTAFAALVDSARPFLRPGLVSSDSSQRLAAAVIMLTGGSKLAQAAAYDAAYVWLDTLLTVVTPRTPTDTVGPRHQVRKNASFWYGLASVLTLNKPYQDMTKLKSNDPSRCEVAKGIFDRLTKTKAALRLGRSVHPPTADQMMGFADQYERAKPQVVRAFKCRNL